MHVDGDARAMVLDDLRGCVELLNTAIGDLDDSHAESERARKALDMARIRVLDAAARISGGNRHKPLLVGIAYVGVLVLITWYLIGVVGLWTVPVSLVAWIAAGLSARIACVFYDSHHSTQGRIHLRHLKSQTAPSRQREHHPAREALLLLDRARLVAGVHRRIGGLRVHRIEPKGPNTVVDLLRFGHNLLCRGLHRLEHTGPSTPPRKYLPDAKLSWRDRERIAAWHRTVKEYFGEFFAASAGARTSSPAMLNPITCVHLASLMALRSLVTKDAKPLILRIDRWSPGLVLTYGMSTVRTDASRTTCRS